MDWPLPFNFIKLLVLVITSIPIFIAFYFAVDVFNPELRLISVIIFLLGRFADNYSTYRLIKESDNKFFEYGLNKYFYESNPTMSSHPTKSGLFKSILIIEVPILLVSSFIYPPVLLGYGLGSFVAWYNNKKLFTQLLKAKSLGKKIKKMILNGKKYGEINEYLDKRLNIVLNGKFEKPKKIFNKK